MKKAIIGIAVITLLAGLYGLYDHAYDSGFAASEAKQAKAITKLQEDHNAEVEKVRGELKAFNDEADRNATRARADLARLMLENKTLRDWWNTACPAAICAFAYGLSDDKGGWKVPGRPVTAGTTGNTTDAGATN